MVVVGTETPALPTSGRSGPPGTPPRLERRTLLWVAGFLAASWLVPVGLNALRFDIALPVLILLGTASLLRAGRTFLDRLVLAVGLLTGATCVAGLLFSVWPWGLDPVPVAGLALMVLVLLGWGLRRRPEFPRAFRLADGVLVAASAVCATVILWPFQRGNVIHNLGLVLYGEDFARHYMMYDGSRCLGGYPMMMDSTAAAQCGVQHAMVGYPQGSHLLYALIENFARSSPIAGDQVGELSHLTWYLALTYVYMCVAVLWSIRWVGGRWLNGWVATPVLGIAVGYLVSSDPLILLTYGYPSETAGLALVPLLVALFARPFQRLRTQLLFISVLTIGISFCYYLWLPLAAGGWLLWAFRYRRKLLQQWPLTSVVGVLTLGLSLVMPLVNNHYNTASSFLLRGGIPRTDRTVLVCLLLVVLACHGLRPVWRLPFYRMVLAQVVIGAGLAAMVWVYQIATVGQTVYYFEKSLHGLVLVEFASLAALGPMLRRLAPDRPADSRFSSRLAHAAVFVVLGLAGSTLFLGPSPRGSKAFSYVAGQTGFFREAYWVVWAARNYPSNDGKFTIIQMSKSANANAWATLYLGMMQRNFAITDHDYHWLYPNYKEQQAHGRVNVKRLEKNIVKYHVALRIVLIDGRSYAELTRFVQTHPELDIELVDGRQLYCPKSIPQPIPIQWGTDPKHADPRDPRQVGARCRP